MTGHLRRLAEHLSTMETGWRRYAWAIAAGLFTALGATAYSLQQPWFGATFFVFAVALLVMSGWSRWYLRTHPDRAGTSVIAAWIDDTWTLSGPEQEALAKAFLERNVAHYNARGVTDFDYDPDVYVDDETDEEWQEGACDRCYGETVNGPLGPIQCACAIGQGADLENCLCGPESGGMWLGSAATSESSPPSTDFPGVEGGEIHPDEASRLRRERRILGLPGGDLTEGGNS